MFGSSHSTSGACRFESYSRRQLFNVPGWWNEVDTADLSSVSRMAVGVRGPLRVPHIGGLMECDLCKKEDESQTYHKTPAPYITDMEDYLEVEIEYFKNEYHICDRCLRLIVDTNQDRIEVYQKSLFM